VAGEAHLTVGGANRQQAGSYEVDAVNDVVLRGHRIILIGEQKITIQVGGSYVDVAPDGVRVDGVLVHLIPPDGDPATAGPVEMRQPVIPERQPNQP
jgi:hypothetical protein